MTASRRKLGALFAVTVLLVGAFAVAGVGTALGQTTVAANQGVSLSCVGSGGGAAYVTDSGLTIYENTSAVVGGTHYSPDEETFRFEDGDSAVNLSAAGTSEMRLESFTGDTTCLGDVDATQHDIAIAPDEESGLTVTGEYAGLAFRDPTFGEAADGEADLAYDATDPASVTVTDTGLAGGETVTAADTADGSELDSAPVGADGSVIFDGFKSGTYQVDLRTGTAGGGESANFSVSDVSTNTPVTEGETLTTTITVENTGEVSGTQEVTLRDFGDTVVDSRNLALDNGSQTEFTFEWETSAGDAGTGEITVATENDSATRSVTIEEPDTNDPPTASDDSYTVTESEMLSVSAPGVLENDTDAQDDMLTATVVTTPSNGTLDLSADGSFTYTPDAGFVGEDSFTYEASDGNGGADQATVTVTITESPPQSANFTVAITETNAPVTEGEPLSVTASVTNVGETADTQSVTIEAFDGTEVDTQSIALDAGDETNVTLEWATSEDDDGSGTVTVQTANDTAMRSVTVDASDDDGSSDGGGGDSDGGSDPNDPPDAVDDSYTVVANATLSVTADNGVLATDSDPDDDRDDLSATVESGPANGTLELAVNGSFVYRPGPGFAGTDSFTYEVRDDDGADTATVTITVTTRPDEMSDPTVIENESAIRQQVDIPENATPIGAERVTIPGNETGPATANFTDATSVASVQFTTGASGNLTVVEYADPPSAHGDVPGTTVVPLQISGSLAVEDTTAIVRTRVSQTELQNADTSDVRIAHRVDGNWELLNTTVVSQDDGSVLLEATTDGFSPFAVTAVEAPDASMTVTPTPVAIGEELALDAGETTAGGETVSYEWSIDGQSLSGETATVTLEEAGEYSVELTVATDTGRTSTATTTVVVENETSGGTTPDGTQSGTPDESTRIDSPEPARNDTGTATDTTANLDGFGFGSIVTLVVLVAIALVARKRRR